MSVEKISFRKNSWRQLDDPWIEVLHVSNFAPELMPYSFQASKIEHIEDIGINKSLIVLLSGKKIMLCLPYSELIEKIHEGLSPLDLKEYYEHEPVPGDKMIDGTILAGISPDTGQPIYAAPEDSPVHLGFNEAAEYARKLHIGNREDFRVPTINELNVLYKNRNKGELKGTFNTRGTSEKACEYWSSTAGTDNSSSNGESQDFSTGTQHLTGNRFGRSDKFNIRCIRG